MNTKPKRDAAAKTLTEYVILRQDVPDDWTVVSRRVMAASAHAAIRSAATGPVSIPPGASLVAIPARSWKPITVNVETRTVLTFTEPTASDA